MEEKLEYDPEVEVPVKKDTFAGIEICFEDDTSVRWELGDRKQFAIHDDELVIFSESGKFMGWYNLNKIRSVDVITADDLEEEE